MAEPNIRPVTSGPQGVGGSVSGHPDDIDSPSSVTGISVIKTWRKLNGLELRRDVPGYTIPLSIRLEKESCINLWVTGSVSPTHINQTLQTGAVRCHLKYRLKIFTVF